MKLFKKSFKYLTFMFALYGILEFSQVDTLFEGQQYIEVQVAEGDTIWGIAKEYAKDQPHGTKHYVELIMEQNQLHDGSIKAGQFIKVPASESTILAMNGTE